MQLALVVIVLILAVAYAGWRTYQAVLHAQDPCYGCSGCKLKPEKRSKAACNKKK